MRSTSNDTLYDMTVISTAEQDCQCCWCEIVNFVGARLSFLLVRYYHCCGCEIAIVVGTAFPHRANEAARV